MNVNKILSKKGWTGRELGILEVENMCIRYKQAIEGKEEKPIVSAERFRKMLDTLNDRAQGAVYNGYIAMHEWLSITYNIAQSNLQQAQLHYKTLEGYATQAYMAEITYGYISELPAIMTKKQYEEAKAEGTEAYFLDEDGKEIELDFFELLDRTTEYFVMKLQDEPRKSNPLKAIRKKYVNEPVKSNYILSHWNQATGMGYYTTEDGKRSDQLSKEEWMEAITPPKLKGVFEDPEAAEKLLSQRRLNEAKLIFDGVSPWEVKDVQHEKDLENGLEVPLEWHYYKDPPEGLTKWGVLEERSSNDLFLLYPAAFDGGDPLSESNFSASVEDFQKEFPELMAAMLKEIDKQCFKGEKGISNIPKEDLWKYRWNLKDLAQRGFLDESECAERAFTDPRARRNGVAILAEEPWDKHNIGADGHYIDPIINIKEHALESFFPESEYYAVSSEAVEQSRSLLLASYYFLMGYNYLLDRVIALYDVPDVEVFKQPLDAIAHRIDLLNEDFLYLYRLITEIPYDDEGLKERKLKVIKDFFQPVDYKRLTIPEANREEVENGIANYTAFKRENRNHLTELILTMPEDQIEQGA